MELHFIENYIHTNQFVCSVKPKEVRIITPLHNMSAGERVELVCQSSGSRPPARITWWKGDLQMEHVGESTSDDGSVTTNFLAFVPSVDDNGKYLQCSASNPQFPQFHLNDGWVINVLCKNIFTHFTHHHRFTSIVLKLVFINRCTSSFSYSGSQYSASGNPGRQ